jgi:glycosyltransferase involved in cell wall biosynthesis
VKLDILLGMRKVLLIGFFDGEDVGEVWLGFQRARRLAARHEVTILTYYMQLRRLDQFRFRSDPWLRTTYAQASCVIGIAPYVKDVLADIRLLFVGRVIRTKGVRDAIRALQGRVDRGRVDDSSGIRVHPHSPDQYAADIGMPLPNTAASKLPADKISKQRRE